MHGSEFRTVASCFRSVFKAEGLSAFYVSYPTTLMMTVPFTAVQFSTYEYLKCVPSASTPRAQGLTAAFRSQGDLQPISGLLAAHSRHRRRNRWWSRCRRDHPARHLQDAPPCARFVGTPEIASLTFVARRNSWRIRRPRNTDRAGHDGRVPDHLLPPRLAGLHARHGAPRAEQHAEQCVVLVRLPVTAFQAAVLTILARRLSYEGFRFLLKGKPETPRRRDAQ